MIRNNTGVSSFSQDAYSSQAPFCNPTGAIVRIGNGGKYDNANICSHTTTIVVDFRVMSLGIGVLATIALAILGVLLGVGILLITNPGVIAGVIIGGILAATALPYGMGES